MTKTDLNFVFFSFKTFLFFLFTIKFFLFLLSLYLLSELEQVSWTHALRQIVINCYKYHGREDLIPVFNEEEEKKNMMEASTSGGHVTKEKV